MCVMAVSSMTVQRPDHLLTALLLLAMPAAHASVLTGEVRAADAQPVTVPMANTSPTVLRFFVADGTHVKKGQPVLRIDAGQAVTQLQTLRDKLAQTRATTAKDVAKLDLKVADAQLALITERAVRDKAAVDAAVPRTLITALDYDRYQGAYRKSRLDTQLKAQALSDAHAALARSRQDGALQVQKLKQQLSDARQQVAQSTVRAQHAGVVVHDFAGDSGLGHGERYEQGSSAYLGSRVGSVVGANARNVRAWALQPDRDGLHVGQRVLVHFDALARVRLTAHISAISGAASKHPAWGDGAYYQIDIQLPKAARTLPLRTGMSARIDTRLKDASRHLRVPVAHRMHADGSITAQRTQSISPPAIPQMWMMHITQMAGDGARVKKGQTVVQFAAGNLSQQLPSALSELAEKKREQAQQRMALADKAHDAALATAKARAAANKARRKAAQPRAVVAAIKYRKLVIDRRAAAHTLKVTQQRQALVAALRKAQLALTRLQVAQAADKVTTLKKSLAQLKVAAPVSGVFLHANTFNGDKLDTGSQVFRGQSVGSIPDMRSLGVDAMLPERDLEGVHEDQRVRVVLTGGASRTLIGHITRIGQTVHSKSRVQPVPVIDLHVTLDGSVHGLKPGQPVRVDITAHPQASRQAQAT